MKTPGKSPIRTGDSPIKTPRNSIETLGDSPNNTPGKSMKTPGNTPLQTPNKTPVEPFVESLDLVETPWKSPFKTPVSGQTGSPAGSSKFVDFNQYLDVELDEDIDDPDPVKVR